MSENPMNIPLPAIVFIAILFGFLMILCIIYQLLKRDKCCQLHGREGDDTEETELLIPGENISTDSKEPGADQSHALHPLINTTNALILGDTSIENTGIERPDGLAITADTTIDMSLSDASFPSIELLPVEEEPVSSCGKLLLETTFSPASKKMIISIVRAADIPGPERGGMPMVQVHLTILPNRKFKHRTKVKPAESPVFNERFVLYPVTVEALEEMSMRVRLYGKKKLSKKVLGELEILMTEIDLHSDLSDEPMWKTLLPYGMVPPAPRPKSTASNKSKEKEIPAELQISLHYMSLTGRLKVEVIKARNLIKITGSASRATCVHILFLGPTGKCEGQSITKSRKGPEPEYNETFMFTMGHKEIPQVVLTISLRSGGRVLGWFSLGRNYTGSREERHWKRLAENSDVTLRQWHKLLGVG
eukprot:gene20251-22234_t